MVKKLAFVFPGQGSQALGMLSEFEDNACVRDTFSEASKALGYDIWTLCQQGPEDKLNQTEFAQPAILTASVALYRAVCETLYSHNEIELFAGHSLGEYSALVCAYALSLTEAAPLVAERGRLMQQAVPNGLGAMAAILGLEDEQVLAVCDISSQSGSIVSPANYNCPGQVVVAGHADAVNRAMEKAKELGAKRTVLLSVSVPSHCELMKPAAEKFEALLNQIQFKTPTIQILHNVDISSHETPTALRSVLAQQLYKPVRWSETIQKMQMLGIQSVVECSPKTVLTALNKRSAPALDCSMVKFGQIMEEI